MKRPSFAIRISTRLVLLTPRRAYKIPLDRRGWLQGRNERRIWDQYQGTNYLAPLLWSCGGFICMERVDPADQVSGWDRMKVRRAVPPLACRNGDLHRVENWGKHQGRTVLLDYGISSRVAAMY